MTDRLQELTIFVRVAETGSFSRTAREMGLSQPSVSRIVSGLEARLGVSLVLRSTRQISLTEPGLDLLDRARRIMADVEDAEAAARGADGLRGLLRVALPVAYGVREVIPRLAHFMNAHPDLKIELMMTDRLEDLVAEGVDVAIRLGRLADSGLKARKIATAPRMTVASPDYIARRGAPETPGELAGHDLILGPGPARQTWNFRRETSTVSVAVEGLLQAGSAEGVVAAARAGMGVALASLWMCRSEITQGDLVPILLAFKLEPVEAHAVFPSGRIPSRKARAFADFLCNPQMALTIDSPHHG
jgi:DNA-binding transcriptional LysR family regulator